MTRLAVMVVVMACAQSAFADDARLGWAVGGTAGLQSASGESSPNFGIGPYARIGYEQSDLLGFEVEASAFTAIFSTTFRGALLVDVTPADRYTVAVGAMTSFGGGSDDILVVGGTARFDFHVTSARTPAGARRGLAIGLGVDLGYGRIGASGAELGYGANLYVGYSSY